MTHSWKTGKNQKDPQLCLKKETRNEESDKLANHEQESVCSKVYPKQAREEAQVPTDLLYVTWHTSPPVFTLISVQRFAFKLCRGGWVCIGLLDSCLLYTSDAADER